MTDVLLPAAVGMVIGAAFVAVGFRAGIRYAAGLAAARDDAPAVAPVEAVVTMRVASLPPPAMAMFQSEIVCPPDVR